MKRKAPFTSSVNSKLNSDSTGPIEETSSDDVSSKKTAENWLDNQPNKKKVAAKGLICNEITREQFISAVNDLGSDKEQLDKETWRVNDITRSKDSVWSRLISKLELNQTENIRHSLYNFWRRNRQKLAQDLSEIQMDSAEEEERINKGNEIDLSSSNSEIKPLTSIASVPYAITRAACQHELSLPAITEKSFILSSKEWKELYSSSMRVMKSGWTNAIYAKVCSCDFRCPLVFKNHHITLENTRKKNSSFLRCLATCKSSSCERMFEIFIKDEPIRGESIVVRIRAVGDENHSADEKAEARHLTGKERLAVGKAANAVGALKIFQEKVEKADDEMLAARNFTGCETTEVIKHAAADYRKHFRLDEDIYRECRIRQQLLEDTDIISAKIKGYVQVVGEKPFRLHLASEGQFLRYAEYCKKSKYSHVYIDATGSIVKSLPHQKTVLLYAAVFKDGDDPSNVIPLGHAILADHTTTSISYFLGTLRQNIVTMKDKVVRPSFFVTDFSPAIFNAILLAFNHEDIRSHLKRCWNVMLRKYDAKELCSKSFLRFCCSHMMHAFARSLSAANVAKHIRKKVMHIFALFINCGELEMSFKLLKRVLHMFGNPQATDAENILQTFLEAPYDDEDIPEKIGPCDFEVQEDSTDPLDEVDENIHSSKAIIHESPFNIEAIRRFPMLSELLDSKKKYENVTNPLFCRRIIYVFYRWFAYLPLWTSLLTEYQDRYSSDRTPVDIKKYEHGRLSNAQVESYFSIFKESVLEKKTNLRPAEVIVSLYRTVQIQLKADKFGVAQTVKNRKGKPKDMNIEELWGKKKAQKKQRNVHFSRIDKYNKKRLASKPISPRPKPNSRQLDHLSPRPKSHSPQLEPLIPSPKPFHPRSEPTSPQTKVISPRAKPIEPGSQPSVFDTLGFIRSYTERKTGDIFNNLTNAALPQHSPNSAFSRNAESFCGKNLLNERDFFNDSPVASMSVGPVSPFNIFSAMEFENSSTLLSGPKRIEVSFESEVKREKDCENEQENYKHPNMNGNSHKNFSWFYRIYVFSSDKRRNSERTVFFMQDY